MQLVEDFSETYLHIYYIHFGNKAKDDVDWVDNGRYSTHISAKNCMYTTHAI